MKKVISSLALVILLTAGVTYAAFGDKAKILGSSFSVGSGDIKLLIDVTLGTDSSNLADELAGPNFVGINPSWTKDHLVKVYNNAATTLALTTHANYATANDPDDLRTYIYVEIFPWDDVNSNGVLDTGELGTAFGKKTITKWKTEGFTLGQINGGTVMPLVLRFSAETMPSTKQGKTGVFDFEFDSVSL